MSLARSTHPTAHEVIVGDRDIPVIDHRRAAPGWRSLFARFFLPVHRAASIRTARLGLERLLDPKTSGIQASTTLVELELSTGPMMVRLQVADGRTIGLRIATRGGRAHYAMGRLVKGKWKWGPPLTAAELPAQAVLKPTRRMRTR